MEKAPESPRRRLRRARLELLLAEFGGAAQVARESGTPKSHFSAMVNASRGLGDDLAAKLETLYGKPIGWFDLPLKQSAAPSAASNVESRASRGAVPHISWVQAGCWADVADPFQPGEAEEWLPCPVKHGPRAYCLTVRGESMHNPGGRPSYADGDIIFVDPDRDANHGDRVIVRLDDQKEATFKQLLIEDGRKVLKALNPDWKPRYIEINGNATMCGVIIGKWVPE